MSSRIRALFIILNLMWLTTAKADGTSPSTNRYQNAEHHYSIMFPEKWTLVIPNKSFTHVKARAPEGYAAISVANRSSLWRDDVTSTRYKDAWEALDGVSMSTFTNRFERGSPIESSNILLVEKTKLGKEKAIKVDYILTDLTKKVSVRIRSFFILRASSWYSISCATRESHPDQFLDLMLKAAGTFEFYDTKRDK